MHTKRTHKHSTRRAALLLAFILIGAVIQMPKPSLAEPALGNGYFVGIGDEQRFDAYFSEDGRLLIYSEFGDYEGRWNLMGAHLCVTFSTGPKAGHHCEPITREGPHSVKVGDHLFLARLARALRVS